MAARPFTRHQALQNQAFLAALAETGNSRFAARRIGKAHSTMHERRAGHAGFAQDWDAALAAAHARFHLAGGKRGPEPPAPGAGRSRAAQANPLRTQGGEPMVVRTRSGRLQLRPAHPNKLTRAAEQAFLAALSATANVRLSAAAAGASARAFYRRQRQNRGFAREMRLALEMGYQRLEAAAVQAALPESHADDCWRHNDAPPIPPLTQGQALQLLFLHEKSVRQGWERPHRRRRRGESDEVYTERLRAMWVAEKAREAEEDALRRAARYEATGDWRLPEEAAAPPLPALEQVTGWSRANPNRAEAVHNPDLALFGGWRLEDWEKRKRKAEAASSATAPGEG